MPTNPVRYTSRDFNAIMADFNSDPMLADKPEFFKIMVAGVGDVVSVWNNAVANDSYLRTALTRRAAQDILEPLGYNMSPQISSSGVVLFDISPAASLPHVLAASDQVAIYPGSTANTSRRFEGRSDVTIDAETEATISSSWDASTDIVTVTQSYTTGELLRFSTSGGLPGGISSGTNYYAILVSATEIKIASSRANAYAGSAIDITSSGSGNHTITRLSRGINLYQQTSMAAQTIGTSDGSTPWQEYNIAQVGIQRDTVGISINGESWAVVSWLGDYNAGDKVCVLFYETNGTLTVRFGDGANYGSIPGDYPIIFTGAYGGGSGSNINGIGNISLYGGTDGVITGVSNPQPMTGGSDPESVATASRIAPITIAAQNRFVTTQDGEALALAYGGLSTVKINKNFYGVLSVQVVGIANGGGNPSPSLRSDIAAYLASVSLLEEIFVQFDPATITTINVTSAAKLLPGYTWAVVQPYFTLAWRLFLTETGHQILSTYLSSGISGAITLINSIFGTGFGANDYAAITRLLDLWSTGSYSPRSFGETIQLSMANGYIQSGVPGIAYMTIAAPGFPVSLAADEITTVGTLTLTQIP